MIHNDHKQSSDPAASAIRVNAPIVKGKTTTGQWKLFFDAHLLRKGRPVATELYRLDQDPEEKNNLINDKSLSPVLKRLVALAEHHRNSGGHRLARFATARRIRFDFLASLAHGDPPDPSPSGAGSAPSLTIVPLKSLHNRQVAGSVAESYGVQVKFFAERNGTPDTRARFRINAKGLGLSGGRFDQFDSGESLRFQFNQDVIVESVSVVAGNGVCGGYYRIGKQAPLAIYCVDADNDAKDQSGVLSDLGFVKQGTTVRFDTRSHLEAEPPGQWRIAAITVRPVRTAAETK